MADRNRKPLYVGMVLLIVVATAWYAGVFGGSGSSTGAADGRIWTCSMHPQIRVNNPGQCPICGMALIPIDPRGGTGSASSAADHLKLSDHAAAMARIATTKIEPRVLFYDVRTVGKIAFDETRMAQIASRVNGRVEQVFADFTGTVVKKDDHLVDIYSPDLVATQEEFLLATRRAQDQAGTISSAPLVAAARRRLSLWGVTEAQLDAIARSGQAQTLLTVYSPIGGTVVEKMVRPGQYVKEGDTLHTIADLSHVWLVVEIYETDLPWVRFGQTVQVRLEADPGATFSGQVGFVEPVLDETTRTVRVRVILKNEAGKLKPGMFAQALIQVAVMPDGNPAPTGLEGKFVCPMHPYVVRDVAGKCPVCEMPLEKIPGEPVPTPSPPHVLAVPAEAVLTTGRRRLVYVDRGSAGYQLLEPHLGPRAGDFYPVLHGLKAGDSVVTRGNFLLDSQFQIAGKPSLLYPEGMAGGGHAGHSHGAATPAVKGPDADARFIETNLGKLLPEDRAAALKQKNCPVTGEPLGSMGVPIKIDVEGRTVFLCCAGCTTEARKNPQEILKKLSPAAPHSAHEEHSKQP
jgi:membrane fusion protein, copper/silver efflux system